ncbi:MAG: hypothetical protein ACI9J3_001656 [Parvicellaceae bacterium]|jgi:hypothetical protein
MKIRCLHLLLILLCCGLMSCGDGFRKQKYTNYKSKVENYEQSKKDQQQAKNKHDNPTESDSINVEIGIADQITSKDQKSHGFAIRKIDWVMAYMNMLFGIASSFILIGVGPTIRGGFSFDRILNKTYVKRDRTHSIIGVAIAIVGILLILALTL